MLLWIIYIDNKYNIYRAPKIKYKKYLIRIYWVLEDLKYKNTKYMYRWYLLDKQDKVDLIFKPGQFLIEKYLNKQQQWDCPKNICLQHIKNKK